MSHVRHLELWPATGYPMPVLSPMFFFFMVNMMFVFLHLAEMSMKLLLENSPKR